MYSVTTTFGQPEFCSRKVPCRRISVKDDEAMKYGLKQHIYFSFYYSVAQIGVLFHTVILLFFLENISGRSE